MVDLNILACLIGLPIQIWRYKMVDISKSLEAKSDQLNAVDLIGSDLTIRIRAINYSEGADQALSIFFEGDNNKPWKPSKGMRRILAGAWGTETDKWINRHARLRFDASVTWAGKEVGGIRISALSDIDKKGLTFVIALNRKSREPYSVEYLETSQPDYPQVRFEKALPVMTEKMKAGEMTLHQVIAQCQKTGKLSSEQLKQLESAAPVHIDEDEEL